MTIDEFVRQFGGITAIVISILGFYYNRYDMGKKHQIESKDSTIKNAKDFQDMYKEAFEDFEKRYEKKLSDQEKDCTDTINRARKSIEEAEREKRGELLVQIENMKERNTELKLQIERLGGFVEGATGTRIHTWKQVPPTEEST